MDNATLFVWLCALIVSVCISYDLCTFGIFFYLSIIPYHFTCASFLWVITGLHRPLFTTTFYTLLNNTEDKGLHCTVQ